VEQCGIWETPAVDHVKILSDIRLDRLSKIMKIRSRIVGLPAESQTLYLQNKRQHAVVSISWTNRPTSQPASQPAKQSINQPTNHPANHSPGRPAGQPASQPASQPANQPTSQPIDRPTDRPAGQPTKPPTSQPNKQPTSRDHNFLIVQFILITNVINKEIIK
jgi:hypothetical protein